VPCVLSLQTLLKVLKLLEKISRNQSPHEIRRTAVFGELAFELTHRIYKNKGEMKK